MNPIITELDEETGEWEIVADHDDEESTLDTLIDALDNDTELHEAKDALGHGSDAKAHQQHALDSFKHLDKGANYVSLADLRDEMHKRGVTERTHQDDAIQALRRRFVMSGVGFEGRHALTDPERHKRELAAAINDSPEHKIGGVALRK